MHQDASLDLQHAYIASDLGQKRIKAVRQTQFQTWTLWDSRRYE